MHRDTTAMLPVADFARLIAAVTHDLRGVAPHAIFDVQNEFNIGNKLRSGPEQELQQVIAAVRGADRSRLVSASFSRDVTLASALADTDAIMFHDARDANPSHARVWYAEAAAARDVGAPGGLRSRAPSRPIYYQEPMPLTTFPGCPDAEHDPDPAHAIAAARAARDQGVAAWTLHSRTGFDLASQSLTVRLNADRTHLERDLIARLRSEVDGVAPVR